MIKQKYKQAPHNTVSGILLQTRATDSIKIIHLPSVPDTMSWQHFQTADYKEGL